MVKKLAYGFVGTCRELFWTSQKALESISFVNVYIDGSKIYKSEKNTAKVQKQYGSF